MNKKLKPLEPENKDNITKILERMGAHLVEVDEVTPKFPSPHIMIWETEDMPYDALHYVINLFGMFNRSLVIKEFNFYCTALGGDSVGWQVTFHLKQIEPKP